MAEQTPEPIPYSNGYKNLVLGILLLTYTSGLVDRSIIGMIGQAIKVDLLLSDSQLGLLQGFAFAAFYALLGIPLARWAERSNRVNILTLCMIIWSGFTALCGTANGFLLLFTWRVCVGIGEAGVGPPAQSLIADYFPPHLRARALGIYMLGSPLGIMIGAMAGGFITQHLGWHFAFFVVGFPGVALAVLAKLIIREPTRGCSDSEADSAAKHTPPLSAVVQRLFSMRSFRHVTVGATLATMGVYGMLTFAVPFFVRTYGLSYFRVGIVYGLCVGIGSGLGVFSGGFLTAAIVKRSGAWYALVPAIALTLGGPISMATYLQDRWWMAAAFMTVASFFTFSFIAPLYAITHNLVEARMRATSSAIMYLVTNIFGLGLAPWLLGLLIDTLAQRRFIAEGLGEFAILCPGGTATAHASAEAADACASTLARATQYGLAASTLLFVWAAAHFFLAARTLDGNLSRRTKS
jgi:predicted MFS family arabinose efflux permease